MNTQDKWNLAMVNAENAIGRLSNDSGEIDWGDVRVAHLDTGYTHHPVFGSWEDGRNETILVDEGVNYIEPDKKLPYDPLGYKGFPGHGTRTGTVLGGDLPGTFLGVARGAPIVPYRVTKSVYISKSKGVTNNIAKAIRHAIDVSGCQVASISLGRPVGPGRVMGRAFDYAYDNGLIVVAAAGQVIDRIMYPGKYRRTIAAGGVTNKRKIWWRYDSYTRIDGWAPADDVWRGNTVLIDGRETYDHYKPGDGTSYATVHVAAAAAMWLVCHGAEIEDKYREGWQRVEAFRKLLGETSQRLGGEDQDNNKAGILDIEALLKAKIPDPNELNKQTDLAADDIA